MKILLLPLFLVALISLNINANDDLHCVKPIKKNRFASNDEIRKYNQDNHNYKSCIEEYIKKHEEQIKQHTDAINYAIREWNGYINEINKMRNKSKKFRGKIGAAHSQKDIFQGESRIIRY